MKYVVLFWLHFIVAAILSEQDLTVPLCDYSKIHKFGKITKKDIHYDALC